MDGFFHWLGEPYRQGITNGTFIVAFAILLLGGLAIGAWARHNWPG